MEKGNAKMRDRFLSTSEPINLAPLRAAKVKILSHFEILLFIAIIITVKKKRDTCRLF